MMIFMKTKIGQKEWGKKFQVLDSERHLQKI